MQCFSLSTRDTRDIACYLTIRIFSTRTENIPKGGNATFVDRGDYIPDYVSALTDPLRYLQSGNVTTKRDNCSVMSIGTNAPAYMYTPRNTYIRVTYTRYAECILNRVPPRSITVLVNSGGLTEPTVKGYSPLIACHRLTTPYITSRRDFRVVTSRP